MSHCPRFAITLALALAAASGSAHAVDASRDVISHGPANCQAALPVFDGQIRKRPRAIANEGTGMAFITCDFEGTPNSLGVVTLAGVRLQNRSSAPATVSCTLVQAVGDIENGPSGTKSVAMAAGSTALLVWTAADFGGNLLSSPAMSCGVPPGVEIYATKLTYNEAIGS